MLVNQLDLDVHDARPCDRYHAPDDYEASQALSRRLRAGDSNGISYRSVRCPGGECVAIFWPNLLNVPVQGDHIGFHWDGDHVDKVRNCRTNVIFAL